jgi:N-dimethylarginine dimethylaminohydrolase
MQPETALEPRFANQQDNAPTSPLDHTEFQPAISASRSILMVAPDFFTVRYAINPWMRRSLPVDTDLALKQWATLKRQLGAYVDIEVLEGIEGLPDLCFSANAGIVFGDVFVPSNFRHPERKPESAHFARFLRDRGYKIVHLPAQVDFEGAGDALFDRGGTLWMGYGERSDQSAGAWLENELGCRVLTLELKDPDFYHLDTCFCPLESGHIVYYPGAFSDDALALIRSQVAASCLIEVDRRDAMGFACNMIELSDVIVTSYASSHLRDQLAAIGKKTIVVQVGEFIKAGGGVKCLSLRMNDRSPTAFSRNTVIEHARCPA